MHDIFYGRGSDQSRAVERRRFKRVSVLRPVTYISREFGETKTTMLDLSIGGAYIESPVVPEGSEIELEFSLVDGHTVRAAALVRYIVLGAGMGVEFQRLSDEDKAHITTFVDGFRIPVSTWVE